ncbi:MAG: TIGR03619 family F420-dependent LLM class oxidoreductase [Actinomycetota bacterium]|nr:TIGR03619 family F420-dependent LLM class oxidoreductase [Actinomycetota bacterium]
MRIGISRPPTPPYPAPDVDAAVVARRAEALGFESIFYGEHPIRPVDQPGVSVHADGVPFFQDTLVALARISAVTTTLKFGGGVFLIPEHNPVQFAKELASLDFYSGGRLLIGAGIGWSQVECELLGGHWDRRWRQTRETVEIMKLLWTQETTTYDGEIYTIPPVQLYPKPASRQGPPVLLGVRPSERGFARIVDYADGWLPALVSDDDLVNGPEIITHGRRRLTQLCVDAGRDPAELQISVIVRGPQVDGDLGPARIVNRSMVTELADAGADRILISLPTITNEQDAEKELNLIAAAVL